MSIKKYTDWFTWWVGLRTNLVKCTGTTGLSFIGSNGIANIGIDVLKPCALNWEQALGFFGVHLALEAFQYCKDNQPKVITETCETTHITKDPTTGSVTEVGSSKTVTTTPVETP